MKIVRQALSILAGFSMLLILLITSFEIGVYSDYSWYQKEYEKYNVLTELQMNMDDVMEVTKEMMAYLRGNRDNLTVHTTVDGEEQEFFNEREKAHMVDVKHLFLGGLWLRRGAVLCFLLIIIFFAKRDEGWKKHLSRSMLWMLGTFMVTMISAGFLIVNNFNKYFTMFHEVFFTNDLWLLDPRTDLLIRMLPEGFFFDMVARIGIIFLILMLTMLIISITVLARQSNKKN